MGRPQDARSDIFSLGGVLYEMLTGSSPFHGESIQAVCTRVLSSTPLPRRARIPASQLHSMKSSPNVL